MSFTEKFGLKDPSCLYKWTWSTTRLVTGATASCHRVLWDYIEDPKDYHLFHNTPTKRKHRSMMKNGEWPGDGCEYCKDMEAVGGLSDRQEIKGKSRLYPLDMNEFTKPVSVTPRVVEIYFSNLCNMSCIYCSSEYSSVWEQEERKWDMPRNFIHDAMDKMRDKYPAMLQAHFDWFKENGKYLAEYRILGGEPFFQAELEQNIDLLYDYPCPDTDLTVFSNLKVSNEKLVRIMDKLDELRQSGSIRSINIICSFDCWGEAGEYIRTGLDLESWEENFLTLLHNYEHIGLEIHGTITNLSLPTLPELRRKIAEWNQVRTVWHSMCLVTGKMHMTPGIFPNGFFDEHIQAAIDAYPTDLGAEWLRGIMRQSNAQTPERDLVRKLRWVLDNLDYRRDMEWRKVFPWLAEYVDNEL